MSGYDDQALGLLSSPGLVRRAHRLVSSGVVTGTADGAAVDGVLVRTPPGGPLTARCPCPATGVCVHIVAAYVRLGQSPDPGQPPEPGRPSARAELLAIDPATWCRAAGVAAVRAVAGHDDGVWTATVTDDGPRLLIDVPGRAAPVIFVAGGGVGGLVSDASPADRAAVHLDAVRRVFAVAGVPWTWPVAGLAVPALTPDQEAAITSARRLADTAVSRGLGHLGPALADQLTAAALAARAAELPTLARLLHATTGLTRRLTAQDDTVAERDLALGLAAVLAHTVALQDAAPASLAARRGLARRRFTDTAAAYELVPLGLSWWNRPDGARGVTATLWDRQERTWIQVETARPAGVDLSFRRTPDVALIWGANATQLMAGPFRLRSPRVTADGTLAASTASRIERTGPTPYAAPELDTMAVSDWTGLRSVFTRSRLGSTEPCPVLLAPRGVGQVWIDEVAQDAVWPLTDVRGRRLELRLAVDPAWAHRADALLRLAESPRPVTHVLAELSVAHGALRVVPRSIVVGPDDAGADVEVWPLDFGPPIVPDRPQPSTVRNRFDRLLGPGPRPARAERSPGPVAALCATVLDVLEEIYVTGRTSLSHRQRDLLARQQRRAEDLAMTTVARAVGSLAEADGPLSPEAVLRCVYLLDQAAYLGADWPT